MVIEKEKKNIDTTKIRVEEIFCSAFNLSNFHKKERKISSILSLDNICLSTPFSDYESTPNIGLRYL